MTSIKDKLVFYFLLTVIVSLAMVVIGCSQNKKTLSISTNLVSSTSSTILKNIIFSELNPSVVNHSSSEVKPSSPTEELYVLYFNDRYGFSIKYPNNLHQKESPTNGDGMSFVDSDGLVTLAVYGSNNVLNDTVLLDYNSAIKGKNAVYEKCKSNWYIVSWIENNNIVYLKSYVGEGSKATFEFSYPLNEKSKYDTIVSKIESNFEHGNLKIAH